MKIFKINAFGLLLSTAISFAAAANQTSMYTAFFGARVPGMSEPGKSGGIYASQAACKLDIPAQKQLFETHVGLAVSAAVCIEAAAPGAFVLRLDALGQPKARLKAMEVFTSARADASAMTQLKALLSQKVPVVKVANQTFYYYAQQAEYLKETYFGFYSQPEHCQQQIPEARKLLSLAGAKNIVLGCFASNLGSGSSVWLVSVSDQRYDIKDDFGTTIRDSYPSFSDCMSDKQRAVDQLKQNYSKESLAGFCLREDSRYKLNIMSF